MTAILLVFQLRFRNGTLIGSRKLWPGKLFHRTNRFLSALLDTKLPKLSGILVLGRRGLTLGQI